MTLFVEPREDGARMPVVLVSGFLGSGKTTLINAALARPRLAETAIAVNEFGSIPLDHHLIDQGRDRTVLLGNGCLCCNLAGDLEDAVMRIFVRRQSGELPAFKRLIIEPSGLADPAPLAQAILRNPVMSRVLRLSAMMTAVDAVFGERQLERHPESRKQVSLADTLVVTKSDVCDLPALGRLRDRLRGLNPAAAIIEASFGGADPEALFPVDFLDPAESSTIAWQGWRQLVAGPVQSSSHSDGILAVSLTADAPLRWKAFDHWLRDIRLACADRLLRVKGLVDVAEARGPIVVHGVHHVAHAPVELQSWPDADRRTRLVLILQGSDGLTIKSSWAAALPELYARRAAA